MLGTIEREGIQTNEPAEPAVYCETTEDFAHALALARGRLD